MLDFIKRWFDKGLLGGTRSSQWPAVRKAFLKTHPICAVCGKKSSLLKPLNVHHVIPYSVDKTQELNPENLITLCPEHHLLFGHLLKWASWNVAVREDSQRFLEKIQNRP